MIKDLLNNVDTSSPINQSMNDKYMTRNPAYNPKTKKGRLEPPMIVDTRPRDYYGGFWYNYGRAANEIGWDNIDIGMTPEEMDRYNKYNVTVNPYNSREAFNKQRAQNQSALEQWRNFAIQAGLGEVVLGTAKAFSDLFDIFTLNSGGDYTNPVSKQLEDWQNQLRDEFAIYQEDDSNFAFGDLGWWLNGAVSAATTVSLLLPGLGAAKIASLVGKIRKVAKYGDKLAQLSAKAYKGITGSTKSAARLSKQFKDYSGYLGQALVSRTSENYMEARQTYTEVYDDVLNQLNNMDDKDKQELLRRNPELVNMTNEERANYIAGQSADETFINDYAMLLMDAAQLKAIGKIWKATPSEMSTAGLRLKNRQSIKDLALKSTDDASKRIKVKSNFFKDRFDDIKYVVQHPTKAAELMSLSEAPEEMYQGVQQEKGKEIAKMILDPNFTPRDIESYLSDASIWEQGFFGAMGGMLYQGTGKGIKGLVKRAQNYSKYKAGKLSEEDFRANLTKEEKIRGIEIDSRAALRNNFINRMTILNRNEDPDNVKKDANGNVIVEDGIEQRRTLTPEEAELKKIETINDYVSQLAINAINAGNYDLLKDYVNSKEFAESFKDTAVDEKTISNIVNQKLEDVANKYSENLYNVSNNENTDTPELAKIVATELTKEQLQLDDYRQRHNSIQEEIDKLNTDTQLFENEKRKRIAERVKLKLAQLEKAQNDASEAYSQGAISKQALEQYKKDYNDKRKSLIKWLINSGVFNDTVYKELLDRYNNTVNDNTAATQSMQLIEDIESSISTIEGTLPETVAERLNNQLEIEEEEALIEQMLPKSKEDYNDRIKTVDRALQIGAGKKLMNAADRVEEWIKKQEDLDKALQQLLEDKVPELKDDLDLLKIGYYDTQLYTKSIAESIREERKNRKKKEEESKKVVSNGQEVNEQQAEQVRKDIDEIDKSSDRKQQEEQQSQQEQNQQVEQQPNQTESQQANTKSPLEETTPQPNAVEEEAVKAIVDTATQEADAALEQARKEQTEILSKDSFPVVASAISKASNYVFSLFRDDTTKYLFEQALNKDINSPEVKAILDRVIEYLENEGISTTQSYEFAIRGTRQALKTIGRRLKNRDNNASANFIKLADSLSTKQVFTNDESVKDARTKEVHDISEFDKIIDEFLDTYLKTLGVNTNVKRVVIDLNRLFYDIVTNPEISIDEAAHILYNMKDYIESGGGTKYRFSNTKQLNKILADPNTYFELLKQNRETSTQLDNYLHISAPSRKSGNYNRTITNLKPGDEIEVSFGKRQDGSTSTNSISFTRNGQEVGYSATVSANSTNDEYTLTGVSIGIKLRVGKNGNNYTSNIDTIIDRFLDQNGKLWEILSEYYIDRESAIGQLLRKENDATRRELLQMIYNLIATDKLKTKQSLTDDELISFFLDKIKNIVFYRGQDLTENEYRNSFKRYLASAFANYSNTYKIQLELNKNNNKAVKIKFGGFNATGSNNRQVTPIRSEEESNIGDSKFGFTYDKNPIVLVTNEGTLINETTGEVTSNNTEFSIGTMGMKIGGRTDTPMLALFTSSNGLNNKYKQILSKELTDILTKFQNKEYTFEEVRTKLMDLFSGPGSNGQTIFQGYNVISNGETILLNIDGIKGSYNLVIYKYKQDTQERGTGITYIPTGDKNKSRTTITANTDFIAKIVNEITNHVKFNRTFFPFKHTNDANTNTNQYMYKENGKFIINIGGSKFTYDNFGDFVLKENAFKTNQGVDANGSLFDNTDNINSIYVDVAIIETPDSLISPVEGTMSANELIRRAEKENQSTEDILKLKGVSDAETKLLLGDNILNIALIPKQYKFVNKGRITRNTPYMQMDNGQLIITNRGAKEADANINHFKKLLIHERLHDLFREKNLFTRERIIDELLETYRYTREQVEAIVKDRKHPLYRQAKEINDKLFKQGFSVEEYFKVDEERYKDLTDRQKDRIFAEEWLVETLVNSGMIRFMNELQYKDEVIDIQGLENNKKSIWQKIVDLLLDLFGIKYKDIKNNSIFAKQYAILADSNNSNSNNASQNNIENEQEQGDINASNNDTIENNTITNEESSDIDNEPSLNNDNDSDYDISFLDDDSLDARTSEVIDVLDVAYDGNATAETFGVTPIKSMDDYVQTFPAKFRHDIAQMVERNEITFACQ